MAISINGVVKPEYTMFYRDFVEDYGVPQSLSLIPDITIGETTFSFAELFYQRFQWREIGAETPEYWRSICDRYMTEAAIIFSEKINGWQAALGDLWKREVVHEEATTDNFYYNPTVAANNQHKEPILQSTNEHVYPHHIVFNTGSTADLVNNALELRNIYYDCLTYCDKLFMSLY